LKRVYMRHRGLSIKSVVLGYSSRSAEVSVRTIQDAKPNTHVGHTSQCLWHAFCNEHDIAR
jgi:hypothetical protein